MSIYHPNPWQVQSIEAFSFLNCPECVFKIKDEDLFQEHAVKNHPRSCVFFEEQLFLEQPVLVEEEIEKESILKIVKIEPTSSGEKENEEPHSIDEQDYQGRSFIWVNFTAKCVSVPIVVQIHFGKVQKGVFSKPSGKMIVSPNLWFLS